METKLCKYCQSEISKKAKVCPNCRKKQGGIGKWIIIAIVMFILIGAVGGSEGESENNNNDNNAGIVNNDSDNAVNNETNENESNKDSESENKESIITVGDTFESNGLKVIIENINTNYTDYDDPYDWYSPKDGYKYVSVSFKYENTGKSDAYVSIYDYDCYADGTLCEQS